MKKTEQKKQATAIVTIEPKGDLRRAFAALAEHRKEMAAFAEVRGHASVVRRWEEMRRDEGALVEALKEAARAEAPAPGGEHVRFALSGVRARVSARVVTPTYAVGGIARGLVVAADAAAARTGEERKAAAVRVTFEDGEG